jgi:hypothetical protein
MGFRHRLRFDAPEVLMLENAVSACPSSTKPLTFIKLDVSGIFQEPRLLRDIPHPTA